MITWRQLGWTRDRVDTLRRMVSAGCRPEEAADALEVTPTAVRGKARHLGLVWAEVPVRAGVWVWTAERVAMLRVLADRGLSYNEITHALNQAASNGARITRNAVLGKAYRLGIKSVPKQVDRNRLEQSSRVALRRRRVRAPVADVEAAPRVDHEPPQSAPTGQFGADPWLDRRPRAPDWARSVTCTQQVIAAMAAEVAPVGVRHLTDLEAHHCRWIVGDPQGDHGYCGERRVTGLSWCAGHAQRVFASRPATAPQPQPPAEAVAGDPDGMMAIVRPRRLEPA